MNTILKKAKRKIAACRNPDEYELAQALLDAVEVLEFYACDDTYEKEFIGDDAIQEYTVIEDDRGKLARAFIERVSK